ncbi:hypothetical protein LEP1GSC074_0253 [Leptospira noguchii str. Hook]|nr:hypothetical protein LEP1GSC041_1735 [Leptospira noguchii str. 2006001870]EMS83671.1 hypothetical protein LEP1GSC074_0253 [Leptospira noguchii str. Hook]
MGTLTNRGFSSKTLRCGNYYKIPKESLSNPIFAQNHCFTAIFKI